MPKFTRTVPNSVFSVADIYGIKLLTRLRVGCSHLRDHEFRHNIQDTIKSRSRMDFQFFFCAAKISSLQEPVSWMNSHDSNILNLDEISLTKFILYGESKYENKVNKKISLASINFVLSTKWLEGQLMWLFS